MRKIDPTLRKLCAKSCFMMNPEVNVYFDQLKQWKPELTVLRKLLLESELKEEFKWSIPWYTDQGKNIVLLGTTKAYCALSFVKGALLTYPESLLQKAVIKLNNPLKSQGIEVLD